MSTISVRRRDKELSPMINDSTPHSVSVQESTNEWDGYTLTPVVRCYVDIEYYML